MELNRSRQRVTGDFEVGGVAKLSNGSAGAPSLTFTNDTDTGLFYVSNSINGTIGGTRQFQFSSGVFSGYTNPFRIQMSGNDDNLQLSGGNAAGDGGNFLLYGSAHSSQPGVVRMRSGSTDRIKVDGTGIGFFGVTPVAQPSAYTPTNVSADRAFDADSTSTAELADVLGTVISDLQGLGLLG